ncbi:MAG: ATP-binding protein [Gammaproteobacteria bacterium]|nr:ATP-binding protein [Gammaproteobacteria bacterium]
MNCKKATRRCPCGYLGDPAGRCRCSAEQIQRYRARVSGPLLDRIDMHIEVPALPRAVFRQSANESAPTSAQVRERVILARQRQIARDGKPAHQLAPKEIERSCVIDAGATALLEKAATQLGLSARAYHRILKVARTIADLDASEHIGHAHLGEAISYRTLDRRPNN